MGSRRPNKRSTVTVKETQPPNHSSSQTFRTLISAIQSREGLTLPLLKGLYFLLVQFSLNEPMLSSSKEDVLNYVDGGLWQYGLEVKSEDVRSLADLLFKELDSRSKLLFSVLDKVSENRSYKQAILQSYGRATFDELTLLLRCCMLILTLADQNTVFEKTQVLLYILGNIIFLVTSGGNEKSSISFQKSASRECSYSDACCTTSVSEDFVASLSILEPSDPYLPFLCSVLEVFADELSLHRLLREYFLLVDSASCTSRVLFKCHSINRDAGIVLEVISIHFIQSLSDEQAFENFLNRLCCRPDKEIRVPELSLTVAVSLLLNPIILSAPKVFHANLILLVSEAIDTGMSHENKGSDLRHMPCYLTAFESSVILYRWHMSSLFEDGHPMDAKCSANFMFGNCQPTFESFIHEVIRAKINDIVTKIDSLWDSHVCNMFLKTRSDLMAESIAYINESQCVDKSCKDDILSILSNIVSGALFDGVGDTGLYKKGGTSLGDIYLLASILKLMTSSMLKGIWCLRSDVNLGCTKFLKDATSCKEYDFIVGLIDCFQEYHVYLPYQKSLFEKMKTHLVGHKTSKWMLLHFTGLLSLSFASGVDFLVKGCVSIIMTLMNLYVFEEGNVDALKSLLDSCSESFSSKLPSNKVGKALVIKKSCEKIALKFQKVQALNMSTNSLTCFHLRSENETAETSENASILKCTRESTSGIDEEIEETCDGRMFLNCVLEGSSKISDIDDLADFIECKPGKDYSSWMKDRQKYRKWKIDKMAVLRWKRKKRILKCMMVKKT